MVKKPIKKTTFTKAGAGKSNSRASSHTMGFQQAAINLFQKWADFNGYASRAEYWWAILFIFLVAMITSWIPIIGVLVSVVFIIPQLSLTVRRLHDIGQTGKWMWGALLLVPYMISLTTAALHGGGAYAISSGLFGLLLVVWSVVVFIMTLLPTKTAGNKYRK